MVAALLMPITIVVTSILLALGRITDDNLWELSGHPLARCYLFVVISLPLFHWAHRFRFTLMDLGLKAGRGAIAVICYGTAILGTVLAALMLLRVWP
jgi:fumarate reductase subunit D